MKKGLHHHGVALFGRLSYATMKQIMDLVEALFQCKGSKTEANIRGI